MSLIAWVPMVGDKISNYTPVITSSTPPASGAAGKLGKGFTFNGSGNYAVIRDIPITPNMSFSMWVKLLTSKGCFLLDFRNEGKGYQPMYYNPSSGIQFYGSGTSTGGYIPATLTTGTWYHLTMTIGDNKATLYINGEEVSTKATVSGLNGLTNNVTIGARYSIDGTTFANAVFQDVRIYNHTLSKKEAKELYRRPIVAYDFEEVSNFKIIDVSGLGNDGTVDEDNIDYGVSNRGNGAFYFDDNYCEFANPKTDIISSDFSVAFSVNPYYSGTRNVYLGDHQLTNGISFNIERNASNQLRIYFAGNPDLVISQCTIPADEYTHIAVVYSKSAKTLTVYKNGNSVYTKTNLDVTLTKTLGSAFRIGKDSRGSSSNTPFVGYMSYFYFYPIALDATAVSSLASSRVQISRDGSLFVHNINELGDVLTNGTNNSAEAKAVVFDSNMNANVNGISEFDIKNKFDGNIYFEPDGSAWLKIVRHNNPASGVFASTSDFATSYYKDADRWFNGEVCNYLGSWELMIKQKVESTSSESKYRWVQSYNPMSATYANVAASNITKNTSSGYTTSSYGGVFKSTSGKTYLNGNNGSSSSWWGALGSYTAYSGGIPGWDAKIVKSGYIELYVRIDNTTLSDTGTVFKSFNKGTVFANHIIEY